MDKDLKKEQRLHKIVAASGFLFALSILPIAQYILLHGTSTASPSDTGTVAGVSTDKSITDADVPVDPAAAAACEAQKQTDLSNLQLFDTGKEQALLQDYQASVQGYQNAETDGGLSAADKTALDTLINKQYTTYIDSLNQVQEAVLQSQNSINARDCDTATPSPSASASPTSSIQAQ